MLLPVVAAAQVVGEGVVDVLVGGDGGDGGGAAGGLGHGQSRPLAPARLLGLPGQLALLLVTPVLLLLLRRSGRSRVLYRRRSFEVCWVVQNIILSH